MEGGREEEKEGKKKEGWKEGPLLLVDIRNNKLNAV